MKNLKLLSLPILAGIGMLSPTSAMTQSYRTVTATRVAMGEEWLRVNVEFAAGILRLLPGDGRTLYQGELYYDDDKFRPVTDYDAATHSLRFGIESREDGVKHSKLEHPQRLELALAPQARVAFGQPNRVECSELHLRTGAAKFRAEQLGNAHCKRIVFAGGVGDVTLDFTGDWANGHGIHEADIKLGLGQLTLRLPKDVGIAIEVDRFLASFDRVGLTKAGSSYLSIGYDSADTKLHITLKAVLGDIDI